MRTCFSPRWLGKGGKGPGAWPSGGGPTSRRRAVAPASPGSSTSAGARGELRRHLRASRVGRRAAPPTSDQPARRRQTSRVIKRRKGEVVEVDPEVVEAPQRRLDDTLVTGHDRIHVLGRVRGDLAPPIAGAGRIAAGIVHFGNRVLAGGQCKNRLRHPRADSVGLDVRQDNGGENPDDHDHYHEFYDSEPRLAVCSSHVAHCFLCWSRGVSRRRLTGLAASSVPDKPSPNKPLISIMKQLEFHGKGIPDAAMRRPDFDSN